MQVVLLQRRLRRGGGFEGERRLLGGWADEDEAWFGARLDEGDLLGDEHVGVVVGQHGGRGRRSGRRRPHGDRRFRGHIDRRLQEGWGSHGGGCVWRGQLDDDIVIMIEDVRIGHKGRAAAAFDGIHGHGARAQAGRRIWRQ